MAKAKEEAPQIAGMRISRPAALFIALIILLAAVLALYVGFTLMVGQRPQQPGPGIPIGGIPTPAPPAAGGGSNYSVSPLVADYGVDSTPQLVINCNQLRVGTFASAEQDFRVSPGTERQDIINGICALTGKQAFCAKRAETDASGPVSPLARAGCEGAEGKVRVYAFHGPHCSRSDDQRPILDSLAAEFPDDLELAYICTPLVAGDESACAQGVASGEYEE